jgi:hypothetical protein
VSGLIPLNWSLTTETSGKIENTTQAFFSTLQEQINPLYVYIQQLKHSKGLNFDLSEVDRLYYSNNLDLTDLDGLVYIKTSSGLVEIPKASNEVDFFTKPTWSYLRTQDEIIINGLGITEQISNPSSGWLTFSDLRFDESGLSYFRHPVSKNWFVVHPNQMRNDGVFPVTVSSSGLVRSYNRERIDSLESIIIVINSKEYTIDRVNTWTSLDEKGLWFGLYRLSGESSPLFSDKVLSSSWFSKDQASKSIKNHLASYLGLSTVQSKLRNDFLIEPGYNDITIKDSEDTLIINETLIVDKNSDVRTIYSDPVIGFLNYSDKYYTAYAVSGFVTIPKLPEVRQGEKLFASWFLPIYTTTSSGVTFTSNFSEEGEDLITLQTKGVLVQTPSTANSVKSFNKVWPGYRWNNINLPKPQEENGLSIFK